MNRCVIVAAGDAGDYTAMKALIRSDDFVLCADGGTRHAAAMGLAPNAVLGDFDSSKRPEKVPVLSFRREKDDTDTMLCIRHGLGLGYRDFLILCGFGGRVDHTLANFSSLLFLSRHGAAGVLLDGKQEAHVVENGSLTLKRSPEQYVSVFPLDGPAEGVYEAGLFFPLTNATLQPEFPLGVSNRFTEEPTASVSVRKGALLVLLVPMKC